MSELYPDTYKAIVDIYHSTTMHEMLVKADLHDVDMYDPDVVVELVRLTAYHDAYWPHTSKRFAAYKKFLKTASKLCSNDNSFADILVAILDKIHEIAENKWKMSTPGGKKLLENYDQVLSILKKLKREHNKK